MDLSGNVWEWTNSWTDAERVYRRLRGGSWLYNHVDARCASRSGNVPNGFGNNLGFRVLSPG